MRYKKKQQNTTLVVIDDESLVNEEVPVFYVWIPVKYQDIIIPSVQVGFHNRADHDTFRNPNNKVIKDTESGKQYRFQFSGETLPEDHQGLFLIDFERGEGYTRPRNGFALLSEILNPIEISIKTAIYRGPHILDQDERVYRIPVKCYPKVVAELVRDPGTPYTARFLSAEELKR